MKFSKMRIWCVPSATELESPKLPPRIDRDVYLRSPPPPPRLSKEEKLARGVIVQKSRRKHAGRKVTSSKHRKVRKVSISSSSGTSRHDGTNSPRPLSPSTNLPQPLHQRQTSLAQTSSSSASRPPSRGGTIMSRQSEIGSSFINGGRHGKENSISPKSSPLSSSGFSGSLSTSVSSGTVSGINNSNVIEHELKETTNLSNRNNRYKSSEKLRYHNNEIKKSSNNNNNSYTNHNSRSKSASRYNLADTPKNSNNMVNTFRSTSTQNFTAESFVAKLNRSNKSNMTSEPSLIMHPGTSRSRDKKNRNKRKKKGKANTFFYSVFSKLQNQLK